MSQELDLQAQRFEIKYIVPDKLTPQIRDFVSAYLELDKFAGENFSYDIHSIYLDSEDLHTYHWALKGEMDRYKLRVRYYSDALDAPVFFEIKRRYKDVVLKKRCAVSRELVAPILSGYLPEMGETRAKSEKEYAGLCEFNRLMMLLGAKPKSHVAYSREAWISTADNSLRVTFDRAIRAEPHFSAELPIAMKDPAMVFSDEAILEIKFTDRYPRWINELVHAFGITQTGGAKYVGGIVVRGPQHYHEQDTTAEGVGGTQ